MEGFVWSDELVKEYIDNLLLSQLGRGILNGINDKMNTFKQSKQPKEKDIPKDWEIVSFKFLGDILTLMEWQKWKCYTQPTFEGLGRQASLSWLLDKKKATIHSVKRLSDGVVFKIGDYFNYHLREVQSPIKEFIIDGNSMKVKADGILAPMELEFISIRDTPKVPLFTTEDGVEIFENERAFYVEEHNNFMIVSHSGILEQKPYKYFSTLEKAKEYILLNKPTLVSYKELGEYYDAPMPTKIKDFFKKKFNQ